MLKNDSGVLAWNQATAVRESFTETESTLESSGAIVDPSLGFL